MTGLEIKNTLERETNVRISFKELRYMTVSKFLEIVDVRSPSSTQIATDSKNIEMAENHIPINYLHETIVRVPSLNNDVNYSSCVLVIPGFEGLVSANYSVMCSSLKYPTFVLPLFNTWSCQSVQEIVGFVFEVRLYLTVKKSNKWNNLVQKLINIR
jgi:hypothetical protein